MSKKKRIPPRQMLGDLDRVQAYMSGKLKMEGDVTLMMQLEDMISKLSRQS